MKPVMSNRDRDDERAALTRQEVRGLFAQLEGRHWLMAGLVYSCGLHLKECVTLRVRDLDLQQGLLRVSGYNARTRSLAIAPSLIPHLQIHLAHLRNQHLQTLIHQRHGTSPAPSYLKSWQWQYLFPARPQQDSYLYRESQSEYNTGSGRHCSEQTLLRALQLAMWAAGIDKPASRQTLRQTFAAHLLEQGCEMAAIQQVLGHNLECAETAAGNNARLTLLNPFSETVEPRPISYRMHDYNDWFDTDQDEDDGIREAAANYLIAS